VDKLTDFLSQMHLGTLEESPLYELARGSTDLLPSGSVTHGPWPADSCAAVLRVWHAADWLELYYRDLPPTWKITQEEWRLRLAEDGTLARGDAQELLAHPDRWVSERADGHVNLCQSGIGRTHPWEDWYALAIETASRLPIAPARDSPRAIDQ
jgi:hypothetical protein